MPRGVPALVLASALVLAASPAGARRGAVATEHPLAAEAGAEMLRAGGTVVDAAIAAGAAVCVLHASSCGLGGGGFALVRHADGRTMALDYRERAPAGIVAERLTPGALRTGGLAVGVPGEVAGLVVLHRRSGRLPLGQVLAPAIRLAREGFALAEAPHLHGRIASEAALLAADPGLRTVFLAGDGRVPDGGFRVVQRDLAATLEGVAARGRAAFYRGAVAEAVAAAARARGGVLTAADLAAYRPVWRRVVRGTFRGREILTFPPPGSGAVVLTALGILGGDDLTALGAGTATTLDLLAGALARAFADRARWYGDPAFTTVPLATLLAPARLATLRAELSGAGAPVAPGAAADGGTAHVSVIDDAGNAVALTTTINTAFGAGLLAPATGVILNNEMDDFAVAPDVPNAFGLTGGGANAPAPGKRPQSSMSPTIVLADGRPELVVGGSGGPTIVSGVVQVILGVTAFGQDVRAAVEAPRIHHQGVPPVLAVEEGVGAGVRDALTRAGHTLRVVPALGAVSAAALGPGGPAAAGDPRKDGGAAVVR